MGRRKERKVMNYTHDFLIEKFNINFKVLDLVEEAEREVDDLKFLLSLKS